MSSTHSSCVASCACPLSPIAVHRPPSIPYEPRLNEWMLVSRHPPHQTGCSSCLLHSLFALLAAETPPLEANAWPFLLVSFSPNHLNNSPQSFAFEWTSKANNLPAVNNLNMPQLATTWTCFLSNCHLTIFTIYIERLELQNNNTQLQSSSCSVLCHVPLLSSLSVSYDATEVQPGCWQNDLT